MINKADYLVHGIQRGGNHAIIDWILSHFKSSIFYNCCFLKEDGLSIDCWHGDIFRFGEEPYEITIASFEDNVQKIREIKNLFTNSTNIIILRDFYNTYASRFEKIKKSSDPLIIKRFRFYDNTKIWKDLANIFLEEQKNSVNINYNKWFVDVDYRLKISQKFGKSNESKIKNVPHFGGGSSFDQRKYDGKANEMKVLKRWIKYYKDKEYVKKILCDKEAKNINEKIFGNSFPRIYL
jgi:hypothetical protein